MPAQPKPQTAAAAAAPAAAAAATDASDDEQSEEQECMLGFLEAPRRPTDLLRHRFPSKVGGQPAWLDPLNLPTRGQLTCDMSGHTLRFLLQVYCPLEANPTQAFHRTIFLFVSPRGAELAKPGAVRALRCQLPRANAFYADTPAPASQLAPAPLPLEQQRLSLARDPWRVAEREQQQAASAAGAASGGSSGGGCAGGCGSDGCGSDGPLLFPEQELVVEREPSDDDECDKCDSDDAAAGGGGARHEDVQRLLSSYAARVSAEGEYDDAELPPELLDELEGAAGPERTAFAAFQARCARAPEQVLRYAPGGAPLWPSAAGTPGAAAAGGARAAGGGAGEGSSGSGIPPCPHCGAQRQFEFQVMPQLLSLMDLDVEDPHAPDWGTIAVYSCPNSCAAPPVQGPDGHSAYTQEFVWVQPS